MNQELWEGRVVIYLGRVYYCLKSEDGRKYIYIMWYNIIRVFVPDSCPWNYLLDKVLFCSNGLVPGRPIDSFRMGIGCQKDQVMIRSLELSTLLLELQEGKGAGD